MNNNFKDNFLDVYHQFINLKIAEEIDFTKFYLYSIITHSTAIEGSTITEVENYNLFENGITEGRHEIKEYFMNLDLKKAYEKCYSIAKVKPIITENLLKDLSATVMRNTGSEYFSMGGSFSSTKGEYRKLNVRAGLNGPSYINYNKVPIRMKQFCDWINQERKTLNPNKIEDIYRFSFDVHFNLVSIHPWADGNGRMSRLLMNYIQIENNVLPVKISKEQKIEYIKALRNSQDSENINIFRDTMFSIHLDNLKKEIKEFKQKENNEIKLHLNKISNNKKKGKIL